MHFIPEQAGLNPGKVLLQKFFIQHRPCFLGKFILRHIFTQKIRQGRFFIVKQTIIITVNKAFVDTDSSLIFQNNIIYSYVAE